MGDRVTMGAGDTAWLFETINTADGLLTRNGVAGPSVTLTVWRCGDSTPTIDARHGTIDADHAGGGVDVHCTLGPGIDPVADPGLAKRGLYLARWRATLTDGQILSFPSDVYTLIKVG